MKRQRRTTRRQYPRVARINELLREILAEALTRIDDDDLVLVTITGVHCDPDLRRAAVYFDGPLGADGDEEVLVALEAVRYKLQRAIAGQAQIKHTPELRFAPDPAVRLGEHVDEVLRNVPPANLDDEGNVLGAERLPDAAAVGESKVDGELSSDAEVESGASPPESPPEA